jgi:hypothetical protein
MATDNAVSNQKVFVTLRSVLELQNQIKNAKIALETAIAKSSSSVETYRERYRTLDNTATLLGLPMAD